MIKSVFAAAAALSMSAGAALAGPYVEIENNAAFIGGDYSAAQTDFHVGYTDAISENASFYVQAGPATVHVDDDGTDTELSGKAGVEVNVTEKVFAYGEVSFLTDDFGDEDTNYGTKIGVRYSF